jgi:hypothetical protein
MFGSTPMCECLREIVHRFDQERPRLPANTPLFLLLISDGQPTDGDPLPTLEQLKEAGVFIASCYVTNFDIIKPRSLFASPRENWLVEARLMFEAASVLRDEAT